MKFHTLVILMSAFTACLGESPAEKAGSQPTEHHQPEHLAPPKVREKRFLWRILEGGSHGMWRIIKGFLHFLATAIRGIAGGFAYGVGNSVHGVASDFHRAFSRMPQKKLMWNRIFSPAGGLRKSSNDLPGTLFRSVLGQEKINLLQDALKDPHALFQCGMFRGVHFFLVEGECVGALENGNVVKINATIFEKIPQSVALAPFAPFFKDGFRIVLKSQENLVRTFLLKRKIQKCGLSKGIEFFLLSGECVGYLGGGHFGSITRELLREMNGEKLLFSEIHNTSFINSSAEEFQINGGAELKHGRD